MNSKTNHIVVVEDEVIIALDIKQCLESFGYEVDEICDNTKNALKAIKKHKPDLVLMDIVLKKDEEGTEVVEYIQESLKIPVVYVTAHSDEATLKKAQITKPYGYIVKPIDENQLNSTIQIALFKSKHDLHPEHRLMDSNDLVKLNSGFTYNVVDKQLLKDTKPVVLTRKEKKLVAFLVENINSTKTYESILENVWYDKYTNTATLRSLVRRIREKIGDEVIENITSVGYRISTRE